MKYIVLVLLVFLAGCTSNKETLLTRDGVQLTYKFYEGGWTGVILVHQLDGSKEDWRPLETSLEREGISYISIDLRGHGDSQQDWTTFTTEDFVNMVYDVEAAQKFMRRNGINVKTIIGSSVGANVVYKYAIWKEPESIILMSPGFSYRGLNISQEIGNYTGSTLVIVGTSDTYSKTTQDVFIRDQNASGAVVSGLKHGKDLLPQANIKIIQFINRE
ncbi:MAG: alpha/beta hydrolase [Candidatus Altiarchaeota archaeon]|nr:alpha/beta hydrolase [Candidatus Altiarchaeota archaeon]